MTSHACLARRHSGEGGSFDGIVAVAAVDPVIANVMFMTERHGLLEWNIDVGRVRRPKNLRRRPARSAKQNDRADDYDA